jgi:hypothetical protein
MEGGWGVAKDAAIKAYRKVSNKSLTDQLLYAILGQLLKISVQLELIMEKENGTHPG